MLHVRVPADACTKNVVGMLETITQLRENVEGRVWSPTQEIKEFISV